MAKYRTWVALVDCEGLVAGHGHVVGAKRGKTCTVPPVLEQQARMYMLPEDEMASDPAGAVEPSPPTPEAKVVDRASAIASALAGIAARGDTDEFSSTTGLPRVPVVRTESGFPDVSMKEVQQGWVELQASIAEE